MKQYVEASKVKLEPDERNLLSVAYKNVVGARRTAWRVVTSQKEKVIASGGANIKVIEDFIEDLVKELDEICHEVIVSLLVVLPAVIHGFLCEQGLLDDHLLEGSQKDFESKVFYEKMKGDYYRYLAEVTSAEVASDKRKGDL